MGIIDFVKGGMRELAVARPDEAKGFVVWKHPDKTIPTRAQVTVEADEVALFFKDGKLVGQLAPGRHTMVTENIPFLDQIVDWGTGGNVWVAEVFFVTTREVAALKFGGKVGKIRDTQSGIPVEVMVNGTFSLRVIDPPKLVIGLVGLGRSNNEEFLFWFKEQVLKTIKDDVAELVVKMKWPLLDVTSGAHTEEIAAEVVNGLRPHVEPYGIEVVRIGNFNLAMKDDDEQRLNKLYENAAYVNMAGSVENYQKMAAANAMMNAGDAMKSGGGGGRGDNPLLTGAGLGVGVAIGSQMAGAMHQGSPSPSPGLPGAAQGGPSAITCGKCGKSVAPGKFCAECGAAITASAAKFCSGCGQQLSAGAKFCASCGTAAPT